MKLKLILLISILTLNSFALTLKLATLTPEGANWANTLQEFAKEVKEKTNKKVKIKFYFGGVQGDENVILQKTRIGQLHGGIFTGKTLGEIYSDVRSMELPFNFFGDISKAQKAMAKLGPIFDQNLDKLGFINLGFYHIGNVYLVTTKKVTSIDELKGIKVWTWEGDKMVEAMVSSLGLAPVPLPITDVHSSLSTGIVDSAYAPPLAILALQWQSKVKYLVDFPVAFSIGSMLISKERFARISPENQKIIRDLATKYVNQANEFAGKDNEIGLKSLKNQGIEFVKFNPKDIEQAESIRTETIKRIRGTILSNTIIEEINTLRK